MRQERQGDFSLELPSVSAYPGNGVTLKCSAAPQLQKQAAARSHRCSCPVCSPLMGLKSQSHWPGPGGLIQGHLHAPLAPWSTCRARSPGLPTSVCGARLTSPESVINPTNVNPKKRTVSLCSLIVSQEEDDWLSPHAGCLFPVTQFTFLKVGFLGHPHQDVREPAATWALPTGLRSLGSPPS